MKEIVKTLCVAYLVVVNSIVPMVAEIPAPMETPRVYRSEKKYF